MELRAILLLTAIIATLFVTFKKPLYGLLVYIILCYVNPYYYWWGESLLPLRLYLLLSIATVVSLLITNRGFIKEIGKRGVDKLLFLLLCSMLASWFLFRGKDSEFDLWVGRYFKYVGLYLLIVGAIRTMDDYRMFLWANILGCFYLGVQAYFGAGHYYRGRLEGLGGAGWEESGGLAIYVCLVLPLLLDRFFLPGRRIVLNKIAIAFAGAFILRLLIYTQARGAFLALIVMAIVLVWNLRRVRRRYNYLLLGVIGISAMLYLADKPYWDRMRSIQVTAESIEGRTLDGSVTGERYADRYDIWQVAWMFFKENPILGIGPGNFRTSARRYFYGLLGDSYGQEHGVLVAAHNMFLLIAAENGGVGLGILLGIVYACFRLLWKTKKLRGSAEENHLAQSSVFLEMSFVGFLVNGLFYNAIYLEGFFWLIGMVVAIGSIEGRKESGLK